ncbi:rhomboid family intramembrane serine protease [Sinimarinibacterium sp. CAU 1509]|uniref:rhomboid family intramembrane serine protease n=1 Tax=Sinimarinibacterium sp. CAU 1509 TaxID=2562283 RepID=UPI0010AD3FA9|nr:rhomboid family intramembrane serine protease [Sinimarinibacterium sp. CAU 1509]TJY62023.1 rhomboid family intramembrane serine protease [Sinimarinibacterium sp. CAU 1509]
MRQSPITYLLLAVNIGVFGLQTQVADGLIERFALWPLGAGFEFWQVFTSAFLHGSPLHLGANMLGVWMFGRDIERTIGSMRFGWLYLISVLAAAVTQLIAAGFGPPVPTVGASGGLFGLLAAYAMLFPRRRVMLLFPPIPMPAPVFVVLYASFELYAGITGTQAGVAHFAHLGGLVGGFTLLRRWGLRRRWRN